MDAAFDYRETQFVFDNPVYRDLSQFHGRDQGAPFLVERLVVRESGRGIRYVYVTGRSILKDGTVGTSKSRGASYALTAAEVTRHAALAPDWLLQSLPGWVLAQVVPS